MIHNTLFSPCPSVPLRGWEQTRRHKAVSHTWGTHHPSRELNSISKPKRAGYVPSWWLLLSLAMWGFTIPFHHRCPRPIS